MPSRRRHAAMLAVTLGALAGPAAAPAQAPPPPPPAPPAAFFDVRTAQRAAADPPPAPPARERLARRLGPAAVVDVDPLTGTPRALQDLDGTLSGPRDGDRERIARGFLRDNAEALGLDAGDVGALDPADPAPGPSGSLQLRYGQSYAGIPAFDSGVRVTVDRAGRVLTLAGTPAPDLRVETTRPRLDGAAALRRLQEDVGRRGPIVVVDGPRGARRTTGFGGDDEARLVLFAAEEVRLAWRVTYAASPTEVYDAVVDAESGAILRRANLVKSEAAAEVYEHHPGTVPGGEPERVDLEDLGYLAPGAADLSGPGAEAYSDSSGMNIAEPVGRATDGSFVFPFTPFAAKNGGCTAANPCTWDHEEAGSWRKNREQATVQAFYAVNRFADHLESEAIGFDAASGAFGGDDPVRVETEDGAANTPSYRNNANMFTPPDGRKPRMQLYLFGGPDDRTRDVDSANDSAVVFHEYTHGLTSRLVTDDEGVQALNSAHAGALGEAWSDWFAQDLLVREGHVPDDGAPGQVELGAYYGSRQGASRTQALDCPVGPASAGCPRGGYTFGSFGRIVGRPQVHADGEIWGETLWDLRTALVARLGSEAAGSDAAEALVAGGLRLTPPEPSFLDARNAILAADRAAGGTYEAMIWEAFRGRGMGFFAAVESGADTAPIEDFSPPPDPGAPRGTVSGRVTDVETGLPLAGFDLGLGGHPGTPGFLATRTDPDGRYRLADVPALSGGRLAAAPQRGYGALAETGVDVAGGATSIRDIALRRDWAATSGGSTFTSNADYYAEFGCGAGALTDGRGATGWLAYVAPDTRTTPPTPAPIPTVTIALPDAVDIRAVGLDPRPGCDVGGESATRSYRIETSQDGERFAVALEGTFSDADVVRRTSATLQGNATGVRFVRLSLLSSRSAAATYRGFTALEVYGAPRNAVPAGALTATPDRVAPGDAVRLDASGVRDPDSAITDYDWDFDADGTVDRTTEAPATSFAYAAAGAYTPRVSVRDFRGGAGTAEARVEVVAPPAPGPAPPPPPAPAPPSGGGVLGQRAFAPPRITVAARGSRGRIAVRAVCATGCTLSGRLAGDRALARALRLRSTTVVARLTTRLTRAGTRSTRIALPAGTRARLARLGRRSLRLAATVTARGADGQTRTVTRRVTLRL